MSENESPFHRGEKAIQSRLGVEDRIEQLGRRMIQRRMPDRQRAFFSQLSARVRGADEQELEIAPSQLLRVVARRVSF